MMDKKAGFLKVMSTVIILTGASILTSCENYIWSPPEIPEEVVISFSEHIYPVCNDCHDTWDLERTYEKLTGKLDMADPESSAIFTIHGSILDNIMVQVDDDLSIKASDAIIIWAEDGAEFNK
ncbi:MAG: hypothetical protein MUC78_11710 [Bacteroidales bacterium]|jgi:hypothetical protein|nr:hypothetical protein [Bacteroidales bacterium]